MWYESFILSRSIYDRLNSFLIITHKNNNYRTSICEAENSMFILETTISVLICSNFDGFRIRFFHGGPFASIDGENILVILTNKVVIFFEKPINMWCSCIIEEHVNDGSCKGSARTTWSSIPSTSLHVRHRFHRYLSRFQKLLEHEHWHFTCCD